MSVLMETNPERQGMVAEAVWKTLVLAYKSPSDEIDAPVSLPAAEIVGVLLSTAANVIAQIPDAQKRYQLISQASPMIGKAVDINRRRVNSVEPDHSIILPM